MGMFDYVDVGGAVECPRCGKDITTDWQTKDGPCLLNKLHWTTVWNFYTSCPHCRTWIEYVRDLPENRETPRFEGYELVPTDSEET